MERWFNLQGDGTDLEFVPRPDDANPDNGDPNTPWYQAGSHAHVPAEGQTLEGVHTLARDRDHALEILRDHQSGKHRLPIR